MPGECYTLEDRLDDAMESEDDDMDGVHDEEDEDEIDPDDGKPVKLGGSDYLDWKEYVGYLTYKVT